MHISQTKNIDHNINISLLIAHLSLAATILVISFYQLSTLVKYSTPILCAGISLLGVLYGKKMSWRVPAAFSTLVACILLMSVFGLMEDSWTTIRERGLAIRQASIHLLIPIMAIGFAYIISKLYSSFDKAAAVYIIPLSIAIYFIYRESGQAGMTDKSLIINNLYSVEVFRLFFIAILLFNIRSKILFVICLAVLIPFAFSLQAKLCLLLFFVARFIPVYRWMIITAFLSAMFASFIATIYWQELIQIEHNIGVRAFFWKNALEALIDTNLLGVGYGTESIIPFYQSGDTIRYFGPQLAEEYVVIGVHSSFFQMMFNTGIIGCILLFGWLLVIISKLNTTSRGKLNSADIVASGMLCISLFINMALDSYNFLVGSAFLIGWLIFSGNSKMQSR